MMRGSPEKQTVNPQEVDKGRRRLLAGAATLVGAGVVIGALSSAEPAYAAVEGIVNFRDRRKRLNSTNSPSHDLQTTTIDISQGQPANVQDTPTPDATVIAVQRDKIIQDDIAARNQNNNYWLNTIAPIGTFAAVVGVVYAILNGQREQRIDREKRDEARFQEAVLALGKDETKLGAATTLRTFLDKKK